MWPGTGAALLLPEADGDWLTLFYVRFAPSPVLTGHVSSLLPY